MARRIELNGTGTLSIGNGDMLKRLRKAPVDRVLCAMKDPQTAREFWDLVEAVLHRDEMSRSVSA
jgi:hypothetical protein